MPSSPTVTVIVVIHRHTDSIGESLAAVLDSDSVIDEIVVVAPTAGDAVKLNASVQLVLAEGEEGLVRAINQAAERCKSDYLALVDGDTKIDASWLNTLIGFCEREPNAGAVGGKHFRWDDENPIGGKTNAHFAPLEVEHKSTQVVPAQESIEVQREVAALTGQALLLRGRAVRYLKSPLFEALLDTPYRELDLLARIIRSGWQCFYVPDALAWSLSHEAAEMRIDTDRFLVNYGIRKNVALFRRRNFRLMERARFRRIERKQFLRDCIQMPSALMGKETAARPRMAARLWLSRHRKGQHVRLTSPGHADYGERVRWIQSTHEYYGHQRSELLSLIPAEATQIIDVGCGSGRLGQSIKAERPNAEVRGIEFNAAAAERAAQFLDDVYHGRAEDSIPNWPTAHCLIFADVLEHLIDPLSVLRAWRSRLSEGGKIVVSLPNVGHFSIAKAWIHGRWDYQSAGVLDRTHLQFFTRETGIEMITRAGFEVTQIERRLDIPEWARWHRWLRSAVESHADIRPDGTPVKKSKWGTHGADLATMQYLIVAKKS